MLIRVLWNKGQFDYVKPHILDHLIRRREIVSFRRRSGNVHIGVDPVRGEGGRPYSGDERRQVSSCRFEGVQQEQNNYGLCAVKG